MAPKVSLLPLLFLSLLGCTPTTITNIGWRGAVTDKTNVEYDESRFTEEQRALIEIAEAAALRRGLTTTDNSNYERVYHGAVRTWTNDQVVLIVKTGFGGFGAYVTVFEIGTAKHSPLATELCEEIRAETAKRFPDSQIAIATRVTR